MDNSMGNPEDQSTDEIDPALLARYQAALETVQEDRTLGYDELPERERQYFRDLGKRRTFSAESDGAVVVAKSSPVLGPLVVLGLAGAVFVLLLFLMRNGRAFQGEGPILSFCMAAVLITAFFAFRRLRRNQTTPFGRYAALTPQHLVQARDRHLRLASLLHLRNAGVTEHRTNGVPTHAILSLEFGGMVQEIRFGNSGEASATGDEALARRRALISSVLEGNHEEALVPEAAFGEPANVAEPVAEAEDRFPLGKRAMGIAAIAVALLSVCAPIANAFLYERALLARCQADSSVGTCLSYVRDHPAGYFSAEAGTEADRKYDEALRQYGRSVRPGTAPSTREGIEAMLRVLKAQRTDRIALRFSGGVRQMPAALRRAFGITAPGDSVDVDSLKRRAHWVVAHGLDSVLSVGVRMVDSGEEVEGPAPPLVARVSVIAAPGSSIYTLKATGLKVHEVTLRVNVAISERKTGRVLVRFSGHSAPPDKLTVTKWSRYGYGTQEVSASDVYSEMLTAAFAGLEKRLAADLGAAR